ncbi:lymphocyte antigen 6E-like [Ahaetulla prasina]|uniref:lymphocyte antigen 6E-like n=1 Tax=Ahaetulla prasina TaxID=499056 RepID=UPI0026498AD4|nr:lymphocyte antigen 6E-like [Ahaetulla prasina]
MLRVNRRSNMKKAEVLVVIFGVLVMGTPIADSIICFTCKEQISNWKCQDTTICSEQEKRCVTLGMVSGTGNDSKVLITKMCAEKCPSEKDYPEKALSSLFCCDCSWCNILPPK